MIRLRPYKSCDAEAIADWCEDEMTYLNWSGGKFGPFPVTAEVIDSKYKNDNGGCVEADNFYPVTALDEDEIIGHLIIRYIHGNNKILRLGWIIVDKKKRGQGYGKQIVALALKYAFEILLAEKVTIGVFENNLSAYNCYKTSGFSEVIDGEKYKEIRDYNGCIWRVIELEISADKYYQSTKKI